MSLDEGRSPKSARSYPSDLHAIARYHRMHSRWGFKAEDLSPSISTRAKRGDRV